MDSVRALILEIHPDAFEAVRLGERATACTLSARGRTLQAVLAEVLDDLFAKRTLPPVA